MNDANILEHALRDAIAAMTAEERRQFVRSLCAGVNDLSVAIMENADELWAARKRIAGASSGDTPEGGA